MQGDVAPKATVCSYRKLSTKKLPSVGRAVFALPTEGSLLFFSLKVFGILKVISLNSNGAVAPTEILSNKINRSGQ